MPKVKFTEEAKKYILQKGGEVTIDIMKVGGG
ncbi:hypothetical protein KKC1_23890 [Calderihabitans maritimus]|nr:hypothetical protein KKC1_23890 [Calderihabitans maritimus]